MVFKTMVALCQEVEPVFWERGGPCHCNAILMTGIHGRWQVQVEIWMMVGKVGEVGGSGWDGFHNLLIPHQVVQSNALEKFGHLEDWTLCVVKREFTGFCFDLYPLTYCRATHRVLKLQKDWIPSFRGEFVSENDSRRGC